jgi:hypothetical protein
MATQEFTPRVHFQAEITTSPAVPAARAGRLPLEALKNAQKKSLSLFPSLLHGFH